MDGSGGENVFVGKLEIDGEEHHVFARTTGGETMLFTLTQEELWAKDLAEPKLELLAEAFDGNVASALKVEGLKGEAAKQAAEKIRADAPAILAGAMSEGDPEQALIAAARAEAKAATQEGAPKTEKPSLEQLTQELMHIEETIDTSTDTSDFNKAIERSVAVRKAIFDARAKLHPEATQEEKAVLADESEGLVVVTPDGLYTKETEAVRARIDEFKKERAAAAEAGDTDGWLTANDTVQRHEAALALMEAMDAPELEEVIDFEEIFPHDMPELPSEPVETAADRLLADIELDRRARAEEPAEEPKVIVSPEIQKDVQRAEAEEAKQTQIMDMRDSGDLSDYKDLVQAGIIEERGDLNALEDSYAELMYALSQQEVKPESEGLPATFGELINTKDTRRKWFGKKWGKSDRAKLAQQVFDLHYQYIESGTVDMTGYRARQNERAATQASRLAKTGRGNFTGY